MTLTRRDLLARAGRLAPLAAAAGMLGRFSGPAMIPGEAAILPDAVPLQSALVGWVDGEPVFDQAAVAWDDAGGWVARFAGPRAAASLPHPFPILVRTQAGDIYRWAINNAMEEIPGHSARFSPVAALPR